MCGSRYLPKFLFNEGSFTQINMAFLLFLVFPCGCSLCTMMKQSGLTGCPVVLMCWWMGPSGAPLPCPLMFCQILQCIPQDNLCVGIGICRLSHSFAVLVLILGAMRSVFTLFVPLKLACIPLFFFFFFLHVFLNFSPSPCLYITTIEIPI